MTPLRKLLCLLALQLSAAMTTVTAHDASRYDVPWHELGTDENSSMPIGNGDIAANVWTEQNGDIVMLIAKSDAWDENARLLKVGRLRITLTPNPFVGRRFVQLLSIQEGAITMAAEGDTVRVWADACAPAIRVQTATRQAVRMQVNNEIWRTRRYHLTQQQVNQNEFNYWEWRNNPDGLTCLPDTVIPAGRAQMAWCHFNEHSLYPVVLERQHLGSLIGRYDDPLLHRCFGAVVSGRSFTTSADGRSMTSPKGCRLQADIYVATRQAASPAAWLQQVSRLMADDRQTRATRQWQRHKAWWADFWNRSWIDVTGTAQADSVAQGYAMNRYMTACAGRGGAPIKFNGSIFTVGHDLPEGTIATADNHDPDFRDWGSCFWNQNTRHIYWPLIATGDYDLLRPWFDMYTRALPLAQERTRLYYGHGGASFIETIHFWGLPNMMDFGWDNPGNDPQSGYMRWHTQGAIEVVAQMLDYYDNTQDSVYLRHELLPFAEAIVTFYNEHWQRGADGKICFDPIQSIEMYQGAGVVNATPDIAGLMAVCRRLADMPAQTATQRQLWRTVLSDLPPIPLGTTQDGRLPLRGQGDPDGQPVMLPAQRYGNPSNGENPELYPVFPYRLYGLGKPDLQLALNTFHARRYPFNNCWGQDGPEAALLGQTDVAREAAVRSMTTYGTQRFPWFWAKVADYSPDMDNGGSGMMTLQLMLMQTDGRQIRLIPCWPTDWEADFKLHAPYNTTVEGSVRQGRLTRLKVTPEERTKDIIM